MDGILQRSIDSLLKLQGKTEFILDLDSSDDPTHARQKGVFYNIHLERTAIIPCITFSGISLAEKLREGDVHSAHGALEMLSSIVRDTGSTSSSSGSVATLPLPSQSSTPIASKGK